MNLHYVTHNVHFVMLNLIHYHPTDRWGFDIDNGFRVSLVFYQKRKDAYNEPVETQFNSTSTAFQTDPS